MSPTAAENDLEGFLEKPTGSGPFVLVDASLGEQTIYERNDNYWNEGKPLLDQLTWVVMPEAQTRWAAIQNGTIHLATELNAATIRAAEADSNISVDFPEARHFAAIWPNQSADGPEQFKNKLVRQAMASAINKEKLVADVLDPIAYVAHGPIPSRSNIWANPDIPRWPYDPERAKALLAEAATRRVRVQPAGAGGRSGAARAEGRGDRDPGRPGRGRHRHDDRGGRVRHALPGSARWDARRLPVRITYWMAEPWNQISLIHQTGQFSNWGRYSNPRRTS